MADTGWAKIDSQPGNQIAIAAQQLAAEIRILVTNRFQYLADRITTGSYFIVTVNVAAK